MRLQQTELLFHGTTVTLRTVAVGRMCCWLKVCLICSSEQSFGRQWFGFAVISRCKDSSQAHIGATEAMYRGVGQQNTHEALHLSPVFAGSLLVDLHICEFSPNRPFAQ